MSRVLPVFGVSPSHVELNEVVVQANPHLIRNLHHLDFLIVAVQQADVILEDILPSGLGRTDEHNFVFAQTVFLGLLPVSQLETAAELFPEIVEHITNLVGEVPGRVKRIVFCQFHTLKF